MHRPAQHTKPTRTYLRIHLSLTIIKMFLLTKMIIIILFATTYYYVIICNLYYLCLMTAICGMGNTHTSTMLSSMLSNDKTPHLHTDWMCLGIGKIAKRWMIFTFPFSSNSSLKTCDMNTHISLPGNLTSSNHFLCFGQANTT